MNTQEIGMYINLKNAIKEKKEKDGKIKSENPKGKRSVSLRCNFSYYTIARRLKISAALVSHKINQAQGYDFTDMEKRIIEDEYFPYTKNLWEVGREEKC